MADGSVYRGEETSSLLSGDLSLSQVASMAFSCIVHCSRAISLPQITIPPQHNQQCRIMNKGMKQWVPVRGKSDTVAAVTSNTTTSAIIKKNNDDR